jgi:hypothetical protein
MMMSLGSGENEEEHTTARLLPPPRNEAARLDPMTLSIVPPELEAAFWRTAGTPAYALSDRYGLAFTSFNTVAIWRRMLTARSASTLLDSCPRALVVAVPVNHIGALFVALPALLLALMAPKTYATVREPLTILQRLMRAVNTPVSLTLLVELSSVCLACCSPAGSLP